MKKKKKLATPRVFGRENGSGGEGGDFGGEERIVRGNGLCEVLKEGELRGVYGRRLG